MKELPLKIRKSSIYILAGKLITPFFGFFITIYIIRKLSLNDYGVYNIMIAMMGYIGLFSSFGLPFIFQRYIPEFREKEEIINIRKLINHGLLLRLVLSGLLILIFIVFSDKIARVIKIDNWLDYFKIFSLGIIFQLEAQLLTIALTSLFLHKYFVISRTIYIILRAGILYFLLKSGHGLNGLLIGEVVTYGFLMVMLTFSYYSKFSKLHKGSIVNIFPLKRLLRYGKFSYFSDLGSQILSVSTDFFVISAFLGPKEVGIYAFANRTMELLSRLLPSKLLQEIIRPAFFSRYSQKSDTKELEKMFNFLTKFTAFFLFPLAMGVLVLGDKLILYVFDPKYLSSLPTLRIVAIFAGLSCFMMPIGLVLQSIEEVQIIFYSKIFAIYNLIADLLIVKKYGIIGVALVTCSAVLFKNLFCLLFVKRYTKIKIDLKGLYIIAINSILMGLVLYLLRDIVTDIKSFIFSLIIGVSVYFIIAYFNKSFIKDERLMINKILAKNFFVF